MLKRFFVSYSRKDAEEVKPYVDLLRATGTHVFLDSDCLPPGKRWRLVIDESLEEADSVIVFSSKNSSESKEVESEYERAAQMGKDIIPILLDSTPLSVVLSEYQYIDFRIRPGSPWIHVLRWRVEGIAQRLIYGPSSHDSMAE
jgi:hypothetical protein